MSLVAVVAGNGSTVVTENLTTKLLLISFVLIYAIYVYVISGMYL